MRFATRCSGLDGNKLRVGYDMTAYREGMINADNMIDLDAIPARQ